MFSRFTVLLSVLLLSFSASAEKIRCVGQSANFYGELATVMLSGNVESPIKVSEVRLSIAVDGSRDPITAKADFANGDPNKYRTTTIFTGNTLATDGLNSCNFTFEFVKNSAPLRGKVSSRCDQQLATIFFKCEPAI